MANRRQKTQNDPRAAAAAVWRRKRAWRFIRPILTVLLSVGIAVGCIAIAFNYVLEKYINPVDIDDPTPVTVVIESNSSASTIAKKLYEAHGDGETGLIANKAVFKIYVDFVGKASKLKAGTYTLSRNMNIPQIVDELCKGNPPRKTIRFTIQEGKTVRDIGEMLVENGVFSNAAAFYELCRVGGDFTSYAFLSEIPVNPEQARDYLLEGYLFPDTYDVYEGSSEEVIVEKLLKRFSEVFTDDYMVRAEELGLTMDEVVNLASLIEKEARTPDFAKVSAVLHNRLNNGDKLGLDASLEYIYHTNGLTFTEEQRENPSLYNSRKYAGIPLGPICNPGKAAIEAALYPDEEYMEEGYYYFVLKDQQSGELAFAKTLEEHNENIEKYSGNW